MGSKFWQVRALAGWGLLLGVPAVVIVGIDLVMKRTYNKGRQDGLKEAKEHVRFSVCVRQLFRNREELLAASDAQRDAASKRCVRYDSDWPLAWATESHSWDGVRPKDVLMDSFDRWLWSDEPMQPVHGLQGK